MKIDDLVQAGPEEVGAMKPSLSSYVVSFQAESFHKSRRHHWMICRAQNPDELLSWGYEPTLELAEAAARREMEDLSSGATQGGKVNSTVKAFTHRIADGCY